MSRKVSSQKLLLKIEPIFAKNDFCFFIEVIYLLTLLNCHVSFLAKIEYNYFETTELWNIDQLYLIYLTKYASDRSTQKNILWYLH